MRNLLKVFVLTVLLSPLVMARNANFHGSDANGSIWVDQVGHLEFQDLQQGPLTLNQLVNPTQGTFSGIVTYPPTTVMSVSTNTTLSPTATWMNIVSTGGVVTLGANGIPAISTTTALSGQYLILTSSSASSISISTATAALVYGSATTLSTASPKVLQFIFDSFLGVWREVHD